MFWKSFLQPIIHFSCFLFLSQTSDDPYSQVLFEARGPGACGLLIDVLTSNRVRTKQEVRTILTKNGYGFKLLKYVYLGT